MTRRILPRLTLVLAGILASAGCRAARVPATAVVLEPQTAVAATTPPAAAIVRVHHHGQRPLSGARLEISDSHGSGFVVSPYGHVVTSHHVVRARGYPDEQITVELAGQIFDARLVHFDAGGDVAILQLIGTTGPMEFLPLADTVQPGDAIRVIGYPGGGDRKTMEGTILRIALPDRTGVAKGYLESDARVQLGTSGSPLLNHHGLVVGVLKERSTTRSRAVPATYLRRRLEQWNIPLR